MPRSSWRCVCVLLQVADRSYCFSWRSQRAAAVQVADDALKCLLSTRIVTAPSTVPFRLIRGGDLGHMLPDAPVPRSHSATIMHPLLLLALQGATMEQVVHLFDTRLAPDGPGTYLLDVRISGGALQVPYPPPYCL